MPGAQDEMVLWYKKYVAGCDYRIFNPYRYSQRATMVSLAFYILQVSLRATYLTIHT